MVNAWHGLDDVVVRQEVRLQDGNHVTFNLRLKLTESKLDRLPLKRTVCESYPEGDIEVHIHLRIGPAEGEVRYLCATFRSLVVSLETLPLAPGREDAARGKVKEGGEQQTVLVNAGEFMELPERKCLVSGIASLERLQLLDLCLGTFTKAADLLRLATRPRGLVPEDGKLGGLAFPLGQDGRVEHRQLEGEVIQGLPEVLNDIADENSETNVGEVVPGIEDAVFAALRFEIDQGLRVIREPGDGLLIERVEVLVRPVQLVSVAHSATP